MAADSSSGQQPRDGAGARSEWSAALHDVRERTNRKRAVMRAVRARSHGRSRADIEADLVRSFIAAGIPQPPEATALRAELIASGRARGVLGLLDQVAQAIRTGQAPAGLRTGRQRVSGERWVRVTVSDDPAARSTIRRWVKAAAAIDRHVTVPPGADVRDGPSVRLTLVPRAGDHVRSEVGVFLGSDFVATVPDVEADVAGLWAAIEAAESADRRLTVKSRIDTVDDGYTMSIALP